ncbi:MAG: hypothetical protein Q7S40_25540 [Opitutaceae bacterium]|nr:hypothetical protein [Opitutaceae bacterium]
MKYRKRPVVIEAIQFNGRNHDELLAFCGDVLRRIPMSLTPVPLLEIETREGAMRASVGDWIIRGVKGEFYPCKPDIFAATYEPVG